MMLLLTYSLLLSPLNNPADDSARVFRLHDVVVTGTRSPVAIQELSSPVQVIDSVALSRLNGSSLADKLKQTSGLNVRSYGGNGSLQSVSVRGMGSDYSLILVNGVRFTTFQIGTVDLGIFSDYDIERIEIANGGSSALYGADAVGGVINIITKRPSKTPFASATYRVGSYGLSGATISAGGGSGDLYIRGSLNRVSAKNNFTFTYDDGFALKEYQRNGGDYSAKDASISIQRLFSEDIISTLSVRYADSDRGQPAAITGSSQAFGARIHDRDLFFNSITEFNIDHTNSVSFPITYHHNRQTYTDPGLVTGGVPLSAYYENSIISFSPSFSYRIASDYTVTAGSELTGASITSNELFPSRREQISGFVTSTLRFAVPNEVILFPSIRYDAFNDVEGGISTKIGLNAGVLTDPIMRIRASYGRNYRVPTFNDLYWIDGGNPLLEPEHSLNGDAGVIAGIQREGFSADLDLGYFWIDAKNKIVWQPGLNGRWSPLNLQSVYSSGIEISVSVNAFNDLMTINYHHTLLRSIKSSTDGPNDATYNKILPFVPQETATISVGSTLMGFSASIHYSFTGYRFETADNDPRYILPTVEITDANIAYQFSGGMRMLRIKGEVNNLFNIHYQLMSGYPLPLQQYALTTTITL